MHSPSAPAFALGAALLASSFSRVAHADPPAPDLLARLAVHAAAFETMRTHASYALDGSLDELDGDGKVDGKRTLTGRVQADGVHLGRLVIVKYTEDGEDKTDDAREKQRDEDKKEKVIRRMPFLATEQARYAFDQVEVDRAAPTRVRIAFVPKDPAKDTIEGSAWVDVPTGHVLSAGFKLSKPGAFVDYVRITLVFGADTPLGPAVSDATLEGKGGIFFFRKRFRGRATLHDYAIVP